jgi:hypothetical protein
MPIPRMRVMDTHGLEIDEPVSIDGPSMLTVICPVQRTDLLSRVTAEMRSASRPA